MPEYKAPLGVTEASPDMVNAILEEGARLCENVLAPLNRSGDEEGCHFDNGVVTTPKGFKQAFARYVEGGWHGLAADPAYGGHGFIREWGMEQLVRDCRIAPIYEGTNGIQALDLLGRKVLGSQGKLFRRFSTIVHTLCEANAEHPQLKGYVAQLSGLNRQWGELTTQVGMAAMKNPDEVGAAAVDYLMYSGYIILAYLWLRMTLVAQAQLDAGSGDADYCQGKLATCEFYFKRLLPRTAAHRAAVEAGSECLMKLPAEMFGL